MSKHHTIESTPSLAECRRPCVATIGNFDGVHRGHEMVIKTLLKAAKDRALSSTVITFEPLAREFFAPESACRLQPLEQRILRLRELGVDQVVALRFDESLSAMSPKSFVTDILVDGLGVNYVSIGDDFRFGHKRAGDFDFLQSQGRTLGFDVVAHETFSVGDERVSSGRVRTAVQSGEFELASELLGRPYTIRGKVSMGQQRGRTIGFPTANIVLDNTRFAAHGVYAVRVHLPMGRMLPGVANIGWRPTVDGKENRLEVHLFDFSEDLYEQDIEVEFISKIRDEKKFDSFEQLTQQIEKDASEARARLIN